MWPPHAPLKMLLLITLKRWMASIGKSGPLRLACLESAWRSLLRHTLQKLRLGSWKKRIDKLAAENLITPALKDWAHELRLDGNEALHGDQPADEELATRMERLTYFLLTYLYTLPAQVAAARELREQEQTE